MREKTRMVSQYGTFVRNAKRVLQLDAKTCIVINVRKPEPSFGRIRDIENIREDENNGREF